MTSLDQAARGASFLHKSLRSTPELSSTKKYDLSYPAPTPMPPFTVLLAPMQATELPPPAYGGETADSSVMGTRIKQRFGQGMVPTRSVIPTRIQVIDESMSLACSRLLWEETEMLTQVGVLQTSLPLPLTLTPT